MLVEKVESFLRRLVPNAVYGADIAAHFVAHGRPPGWSGPAWRKAAKPRAAGALLAMPFLEGLVPALLSLGQPDEPSPRQSSFPVQPACFSRRQCELLQPLGQMRLL